MASASTAAPPEDPFLRRDHPWLLPSNRRLRNVINISLRNLSPVNAFERRHRGQTTDDDALPNTRNSPAKLVALAERKALEHSHSSNDLRKAIAEEDAGGHPSPEGSSGTRQRIPGKPSTPPRPSIHRMRRRSTLEWANATPQRRQERLESLAAERMASVFFTCHVEGVEEPIYTSEIAPHTMNPTFCHVDFSRCGPAINRLDAITVRVWAKTENMESCWRQLIQSDLNLARLQYLGKAFDDLSQPLPSNTIVAQLIDGIYISAPSLSNCMPQPSGQSARSVGGPVSPTSSFDALLRLSKLDDSIQDALATHYRFTAALEKVMEMNRAAFSERDRVAEAKDRLKTVEYARKTIERQLHKARQQQEEKRGSLTARRSLMHGDLRQRSLNSTWMHQAQPELPHQHEECGIKQRAIQNQRRRICEDVQKCYPVLPVPRKSLAFTIRDLHLPNSDDLDDEPPDKVAAALGHVAHVVVLLSLYLRHPLPYPIRPRSSTSAIEDPLSLLKSSPSAAARADESTLRTYPLFSKGVPRFRFEYAVFLLNKDIQVLLETAYGVRVVDLRHTLPNLKYLLYVATAGAGELPARKAGGVRGLLRAQSGSGGLDGRHHPSLKRQGSDGSTDSALEGLPMRFTFGASTDGRAKGAVESLRRNFAAGGKKNG